MQTTSIEENTKQKNLTIPVEKVTNEQTEKTTIKDVDGILDDIIEEQETELIKQIESDQQVQGILDDIVEEKETELIKQIESDQQVQGILDDIVEEKETELIKQIESEQQQTLSEPSPAPSKIDVNVTPDQQQTFKTTTEYKNDINTILNNFQPEKTLLQVNADKSESIKSNEFLNGEMTPSNNNSMSFLNNENINLKDPIKLDNLTPQTNSFYNLFANRDDETNPTTEQKTTTYTDELTDLFDRFNSNNQTLKFEPFSELPSNDLYSQTDTKDDTASAEILENTKLTNTTLQTLTQLVGSLIQAVNNQSQMPNQPIVMPSEQTPTQKGVPDALLASEPGMIPGIRGKFIYNV